MWYLHRIVGTESPKTDLFIRGNLLYRVAVLKISGKIMDKLMVLEKLVIHMVNKI